MTDAERDLMLAIANALDAVLAWSQGTLTDEVASDARARLEQGVGAVLSQEGQ